METIKVKIWTGEEMLGPFNLSQNPKYWASEMKDGVVLLSTGLEDENGTEIYSGDIYQYEITVALLENKLRETSVKKCAVVEFKDGAFMVEDYTLCDALENDDNPIIIGNIYENPELLQEEL